MPRLMVGEVMLELVSKAQFVYLEPNHISARQWKYRLVAILTERERSLSSLKVGEVSEGRTGVRVPAMYAVFSCSSQP